MDYRKTAYELINLGNNCTVSLYELVNALGSVLGSTPRLNRLPPQPGDVPQTWADLSKASRLLDYNPKMKLHAGLCRFAEWLQRDPSTMLAPV